MSSRVQRDERLWREHKREQKEGVGVGEETDGVEVRADARIAELGDVVDRQLPALTAWLQELLPSRIPELHGDDGLLRLLGASIASNLETLVHVLRDGLPVSEATAPAAALEYARRLAQRGIGAAALIRSYRVAQRAMLDWSFERFRELEPDHDVALVAGRRFTDVTFGYIDSLSEQVVVAYELERERWLSHRSTLRTSTVESLVAGGRPGVEAAERALGHRLRQHHVGVVLWSDAGAPAADAALLERALDAVAQVAGATRPLLVVREQGVAWGWLGLGGRADGPPVDEAEAALARVAPGVRVGLGTPGAEVEGFRDSHREALRCRAVAVAGGVASPLVTSYASADVRTASVLAADLESARGLVVRALGGLAAAGDQAARLRETLRAFLGGQSSYVAAAERLHLHKNTVRYRVERAVELRGRSLEEDRLELELALVACALLGPSVLPA